MKYETGICCNCGADKGLHRYGSMQCPKYGIEEIRFDKLSGKCYPQQWESITFEDSGLKKIHDAAPELLETLIWCSKKLNEKDSIGLDDIDNKMKEAIKKATL